MPFSEFLLTKYKAGIEFHPNLGFLQGTLYLGMGWPMLKRVCVFTGSALFLLLFTAISVSAQVITGEITGTVTDPSGASVPGATVAATCAATNASRTATTGNSGSYVLSNLPPCSYSLSVSAQGFKTSLSSADAWGFLPQFSATTRLGNIRSSNCLPRKTVSRAGRPST